MCDALTYYQSSASEDSPGTSVENFTSYCVGHRDLLSKTGLALWKKLEFREPSFIGREDHALAHGQRILAFLAQFSISLPSRGSRPERRRTIWGRHVSDGAWVASCVRDLGTVGTSRTQSGHSKVCRNVTWNALL